MTDKILPTIVTYYATYVTAVIKLKIFSSVMSCFPFYAELRKVVAIVTYVGNFCYTAPLPTPTVHVLEFHFLQDNALVLIALTLILQPFFQLVSVWSL